MSFTYFSFVFLISSFITYFIINKIRKKFFWKTTQIKSLIKHTPITPENTIIVFDLHDVIVNYDYIKIIKTFFASKGKLKLFITMLNPFVWWNIIKLIYNNAIAEQYIIGLGKEHKNLTPYIPLGIAIANCQKANPKMIILLKELKNKGYTLQLFSNIGTQIFKDFKQKNPHIINYFDKVILPSQENGYLRKPHQNAFLNFLEKNKENSNKQILFIDDKEKNTHKALSHGIIGISFKSEAQLRELFTKLGIF